jgi:hypothetical protein
MPATINGTSGFGGNLTGNVTGNADTSTTAVTANKLTTTTGDAPTYACRAWVNFDGTKDTTGAVSTANTNRLIRASGNVTSVLRNGTGDYTITFTAAMPEANYTVCASAGLDSLGAGGAYVVNVGNLTTASCKLFGRTIVPAAIDLPQAHVSIFR